jgi:hypothetical protein
MGNTVIKCCCYFLTVLLLSSYYLVIEDHPPPSFNYVTHSLLYNRVMHILLTSRQLARLIPSHPPQHRASHPNLRSFPFPTPAQQRVPPRVVDLVILGSAGPQGFDQSMTRSIAHATCLHRDVWKLGRFEARSPQNKPAPCQTNHDSNSTDVVRLRGGAQERGCRK